MRRAQGLKIKARGRKLAKTKASQLSDSDSEGESNCDNCPACVLTTLLDRYEDETSWDMSSNNVTEYEFLRGILQFKELESQRPKHYFGSLLSRAESMLSKIKMKRLELEEQREEYQRVCKAMKNASKKARRQEEKTRTRSVEALIKGVAEDACRNVVKAASNDKQLPQIQSLSISDNTRAPSFECPVCFDCSDDKLALNCGHVFCAACAPSVGGACYVCATNVAMQIKLFN